MIPAPLLAMGAFFLDTVLGDPQTRWHPVAVLGRFISLLERLLYPTGGSNQRKFVMGSLLVLFILCIAYAFAEGLLLAVRQLPVAWGSDAVSVLLLYFCISPRMLAKAGQDIYMLLVKGDLPAAREHVGYIVGRDTAQLDEADAARAAIETVAENTVDGVIAPFFFFALGGAPLAVLYRAANTMDSMLGYRNERYLYFGRMAARVDDVLNYIPARISGVLFVMAAFLLGYDGRNALNILVRDAAGHPSPNGGHAEAPVAGALHIRLGGINYYFGERHFRAYMGDAHMDISAKHILGAIRLMYTVAVLFLLFYYLFSLYRYN
ncbi:adenosylcobinamide-phosphate synthase CbiB [Selenomonas sp. oral taxon 892]|jgi:cobalamin biosynthesis protein cobD|uniref:adenosylcobinamide-phosphate synthase CbiB n=1 Tax=Selenomonas sp. oral taxon 892 TaxID=1321785 RepID=UPI0003AD4BCA|nr:adenosylcobinamide-phosphate synthase CbiB [Selenomonas sp. oral taxon 892]ERJ95978.1 cobalamin biosynthesis protein CobD [Selenomonas sp. oral taxon 892 str. F0426]